MPVTIRSAVPEDIPAVSVLLIETWHDTYDALLGSDKVDEITRLWHAPAVLQQQLKQRGTCFLVAESEGAIVGHAFATSWNLPVLHIARLYIHPDWQRQGIGNRFLDRLISLHPTAGRLTLTVEKNNRKGVRFYLRHGFGVIDETVEDGAVILMLEKPLPQR